VPEERLARRIGFFDAIMVVMGGIVGSGIFVTPASVAAATSTRGGMLAAWACGGVTALVGAFIYADLSRRRPFAGGQYVYLREAYHPALGFLYGWALLLVIQSGGMAACAVTFARYFGAIAGVPAPEGLLAAATLAALVSVNCLGVVAGARTQSGLMVLKILAIAAVIGCGLLGARASGEAAPQGGGPFAAALIPVLFSYGGFQTACFVAGEMKEPQRDLPRALVAGVTGVALLYVGVAFACDRILGKAALEQSLAPAVDVARHVLGPRGAAWIGAGVALSSLGFLSQSILTAPRVYFAMGEDGAFLRRLARVHPATRAPVMAIAVQGSLAAVLALTGTFEVLVNYVVSIDFIFFALTASCLFVFRRRGEPVAMPGHPFTTALFIAVCAAVVAATFRRDPVHSLAGLALTLAGFPVYLLWRRNP
jgi:basic amino acid/polyamine antiporter, APA family